MAHKHRRARASPADGHDPKQPVINGIVQLVVWVVEYIIITTRWGRWGLL